jgi:hypothetical protein
MKDEAMSENFISIEDFLKILASWERESADISVPFDLSQIRYCEYHEMHWIPADGMTEKQSSCPWCKLDEAINEVDWWKKKHAEDCQEIRLVGRREGEKLMREKCQKACIDVARSESYYSDNVGDECAEAIYKIEISRSLEK